MIRVYIASMMKHAQRWRELCATTAHIQCHARWLKNEAFGVQPTPANAREFWLQDEQDVRDADAVIVFADGDDVLRGALVEAGMAIAYGVPVIVIGEHFAYSTWQYHPGVMRADCLDSAVQYLRQVEPRYRKRVSAPL